MRHVINALLRSAGWELRRTALRTRPTMRAGLEWLSARGFRISTVLDVGASDGRWSADCMTHFPEATYVLFEPQPVHRRALDRFVAVRHGVVVVPEAVGAAVGTTLFDASDAFGGALARDAGPHTIEVPCTTLDDAMSRTPQPTPYLLKLDTHGYERSIFAGGRRTLGHFEAIIVEAYNFRISDEAFLFWELCAFLAGAGFRPVDLVDVLHRRHDDALWQMDLVFVRSTWPGFPHRTYT